MQEASPIRLDPTLPAGVRSGVLSLGRGGLQLVQQLRGAGWAQPGATSSEMARAAAFLYLSGGVLSFASLALPQTPGGNPTSVALVASLALVTATLLAFLGPRLPLSLFPVVTVCGTALISAAILVGGGGLAPYAFFYVWVALYSFSFFTTPMAIAQCTWLALAAALTLAVAPNRIVPSSEWLLIVGTAAVAGHLVQRLVQQVRQMAHSDPLTGLPNRRAWDQELARALAGAARDGRSVCVAVLDLDHFKIFNDELGHQAGDRLLQEVAHQWAQMLRRGDLVARYGGEEFALLLPGCQLARAMATVERLRTGVPRGQTCSAGVAAWDGQETADALLARADSALYEAKRSGRDRAIAAPEPASTDGGAGPLQQSARWTRVVLETLAGAALEVRYQPVVRMETGEIVGYEALSRPSSASEGESVEGFFATAQRIGAMHQLDWMCRKEAILRSVELPDSLPVFLNVSIAALLDSRHGLDETLSAIRWVGRTPADFVLEVTERETVSNLERLVSVLERYRALGFTLAIDDVGDGNCTFEMLAAIMPDFIKISGRFCNAATHAGPRSAIVGVLAFARASGASVVAEGIEDGATANLLRALGVQLGQGYLLGRPSYPAELGSDEPATGVLRR